MRCIFAILVLISSAIFATIAAAEETGKRNFDPISVTIQHVSTDKSVNNDYDIVYIRAPRDPKKTSRWADISGPAHMDLNADLMLLHPNGTEELLVAGGEDGAIADPCVSFDGEWVYYAHVRDSVGVNGGYAATQRYSDLFKIQVKSRQIVRLTHQELTPNTGAAPWSKDFRTSEKDRTWKPYGALNLGPCQLPGGKVMFVSSRNGFQTPKHNDWPTLQLFVMGDDGSNVEQVGYLNLSMALHPVILMDGRVMFSSLESQGLRKELLWGVWSIHPDGTNWGPVFSAFSHGGTAYHFQTQLSDGHLVIEGYYQQNDSGFGSFFTVPLQSPYGVAPFGSAARSDPRNPKFFQGRGPVDPIPFTPAGTQMLTRFARPDDSPADLSVLDDPQSPRVGKVTHPSGAPDDHLLCVWSAGAVAQRPLEDAGIYLIKSGKAIDAPGQMLLIKNDPKYHEQWPRALVPYNRIYGIDEPKRLAPLLNDGQQTRHLPEGTPFGLVGTSSLYKRESAPRGAVPPGSVSASQIVEHFNWYEAFNWIEQGADAGQYDNGDIHAIRILAMEPTTDRPNGPKAGRRFYSHASERLRILGEIPVRKFKGDDQPLDPDGNPDTSFLAKIPADVAFTFQTLDKRGMVLNMAQTWHQLRPGEIRNDCGGCHAHSQKPTLFKDTAAASDDYAVFDLTRQTPLLTNLKNDQSGKQWDSHNETGLRFAQGVHNVEYFRDVVPILERSCVACHTQNWEKPAADLVLDDSQQIEGVPGTYYRLAWANQWIGSSRFGPKSMIKNNGQYLTPNASRYIRRFQSRRSLLIWKVFGERLDGYHNDDFPTETTPGDPNTLHFQGEPVPPTDDNRNRADLDYNGLPMPPPDALTGDYVGPGGQKIEVPPLSDDERLTLARWIDLGCPIDLDYNPAKPEDRGYGWMLDDNRPTLTLTYPRIGVNESLSRILVGMYDYDTGLDLKTFSVVADFPIDGVAAGENLAGRFRPVAESVWEWQLAYRLAAGTRGTLNVSIADRQGNTTRIVRSFSVVGKP